MTQLELHKKIDEQIAKGTTGVKPESVLVLISVNKDAHQYFFAKADEGWLDWLWKKGFLDAIKEKAEDPTRYSYRTQEVNYLVRMAEKVPAKVVNIMLRVSVSSATFNPEVVDRFLRICSILPADQLARVVKKIRDERWIPLMGAFNQWGFEYEKMFKVLDDAKKYEELLVLAEEVLSVRSREEIKKTNDCIGTDNPFYFSDLSYTKVFEYLNKASKTSDQCAEEALALAVKIITQVIGLWGKEEDSDKRVFKVYDRLLLFDGNFFSLDLGQKKHLSPRDDVRELATVIKVLLERLVEKRCDKTEIGRAHV